MIVFACDFCKTPMCVDDSQVGTLVRCPTCMTTVQVPSESAALPVPAPKPKPTQQVDERRSRGRIAVSGISRAPGKRYGFNCAYCSSRLEANEGLGGQEGQCPTCGNNIVIPILDRYGRLIDPITREIIKQDPHPVHAYAAAGERAPEIVRQTNGAQSIKCPRCQTFSTITSNNCRNCGMPFTMEGTTLESTSANNGFCVASLVLGILGIPASCTVIAPALAVVFGVLGFVQVTRSGTSAGRGMAIAGVICGAIGTVLSMVYYLHH